MMHAALPPSVAGIIQRQYASHARVLAVTSQVLFTGPATVGSQSGTLTLTFTPDAPVLTVTGYSPNPVNAGGLLTITGTGFAPGATVSYLGQLLPVVALTATSLSATAPTLTSPGSGPVLVTSGGVTAAGPMLSVNAVPAPAGTITGVTTWNGVALTAGRGGDFILINGTGFGASVGTMSVAGLIAPPAAIHRWTDKQVALFLPANAGPDRSGSIIVTPPGQAAVRSTFSFMVAGTGPALPTAGDPAILGYLDGNSSPNTFFPEGSSVRVSGKNFGAAPGSLILAGAPFPYSAWSDTEVVFAAPKATIPGSTVTTSMWQTVGIMRSDRRSYTDQWGVKFQQPRVSPATSQEADPIPLPWAGEPPVWVETQPFAVAGKYYDLQVQVKPAPGTPPTGTAYLPPVVTAPVVAGGHYWTLEVTVVPAAGGPPAVAGALTIKRSKR